MPRKLIPATVAPILVAERLQGWGRCVCYQRRVQRITAAELARRAGVSPATLQRIEAGDAGVSAAAYLGVLGALGFLDGYLKELAQQFEMASVVLDDAWRHTMRQRAEERIARFGARL